MSTFEIVEVGLPNNDDRYTWIEYWKAKKQPWRTEPRISKERQEYLAERRKIELDDEQGIYPFKDIDPKLNRADVEWLLSTHENNRGPVDWNDESQHKRVGLDLRGAYLCQVNLSNLPLAKCNFNEAYLEGANFSGAQLQCADLPTFLKGADFFSAQLQQADLTYTELQQASLSKAQLQGANLGEAQLQGANLREAQLQGANLGGAQLQGANLREAQLQGVFMGHVTLAGVDHIGPQLADVQWGDTNLTVVDWTQISMLGDEYEAKKKLGLDWTQISMFGREYEIELREINPARYGKKQAVKARLVLYMKAARAYRQLFIVLRNQGIEEATWFAYRAQLMQRKVFWYQRKFLSFLGSLFLDLLSGYGYKVGRCFIAYALVIGIFATIYHLLGTHPAWNESIVISMTAFHLSKVQHEIKHRRHCRYVFCVSYSLRIDDRPCSS